MGPRCAWSLCQLHILLIVRPWCSIHSSSLIRSSPSPRSRSRLPRNSFKHCVPAWYFPTMYVRVLISSPDTSFLGPAAPGSPPGRIRKELRVQICRLGMATPPSAFLRPVLSFPFTPSSRLPPSRLLPQPPFCFFPHRRNIASDFLNCTDEWHFRF